MYPGGQIMKETIQHTTRMGNILPRMPLKLQQKPRNIFLQRNILSEVCATDIIVLLSQVLKGAMWHNY